MSVSKDVHEQELNDCAEGQQPNETVPSTEKPDGTRMGTFLNWRHGVDDKAPVGNQTPNRLRDGSK
jgi:hypothetical protein